MIQHFLTYPQEVAITGTSLCVQEAIAHCIPKGKRIEHVLPVSVTKHKCLAIDELPLNVCQIFTVPETTWEQSKKCATCFPTMFKLETAATDLPLLCLYLKYPNLPIPLSISPSYFLGISLSLCVSVSVSLSLLQSFSPTIFLFLSHPLSSTLYVLSTTEQQQH